MKKRLHCVIKGRVQGVCFRMYTCEEAGRLGLTGWVRNCRDGSVELVAEGEESFLKELAEWCGHGPSYAGVTSVRSEYSGATGEFSDFRVSYG